MSDLKKKVIGVVMGGVSGEREISLKSGAAVAKALRSAGFEAREVVVDDKVAEQLPAAGIDVAFIALHGGWGEDGRVQALCEMLDLSYTGSGVLASGLAMNKMQAKTIFVQNDIPTPEYCPGISREFVLDTMGFSVPLVIKPTAEGSTLGVHIVREMGEFDHALADAKRYDETPIVEQYIPGREITVGVLAGEALGVVEIVPKSGFYDYESKYTEGASEYVAPADVDPEVENKAREFAARSFESLGCQGAARVDLRLDPDRGLFVLEVNTIPGMTPLSLLPMSAAVTGISFEQLCERIVGIAVEVK